MLASYLKDLNIIEEKTSSYRHKGVLYYNIYLEDNTTACPDCTSTKFYKNGKRVRKIAHSASNFEKIILNLNIQKYLCPNCNGKFEQEQSICPKGKNTSFPTILTVLDRLMNPSATFSSVAKDLFLTKQTVHNIFNRNINFSRLPLPDRLSFDEKHVGGDMVDNYAFIMIDWNTNEIIDICPSRKKIFLERYFRDIPLEERLKVKSISIDMWETYKNIAKIYFPNAIIVVDSFHVMENINRAMNSIRIHIMNKFDNGSDELENNDIFYYMLKKFGYYFISEIDNLAETMPIRKMKTKWNKNEILKYLLQIDTSLKECYELVRDYREFNRSSYNDNSANELDELIERFFANKYMVFKKIGVMLSTWKEEILNSIRQINIIDKTTGEVTLTRRLSNGPIEGINSILEKIITNGNGYTNFNTFRNRAMFCVNKTIVISEKKHQK